MGMQFKSHTGDWVEISSPIDIDGNRYPQPLVVERREKYSFPFGDAELVQLLFANAHIVYGDMILKTSVIHLRATDASDVVELHFALDGPGHMTNLRNGHSHYFNKNEHNLVYVPDFEGVASYQENTRYRFFEVHFLVSHFIELVKGSGPLLENFAEKVLKKEFVVLSKHNLPSSVPMHQCINDIMECKYTGGLKFLYLQSKCIELLTMQAMAFQEAEKQAASSVIKSTHDKESIVHAQEYLLQHIDNPPTLSELAAIAGTNEFKLKKGFKELYNNTVFGYLSDNRLLQAQTMLKAGHPIKVVAEQLGYSSVQHFSTAFKKKFGVPPGKV